MKRTSILLLALVLFLVGAGIAVAQEGQTTPDTTAEGAGGKIAFAVFNPASGKYDIYVANADGSERQLLIEQARQPAFNHDGKMLAADSLKDDRPHLIIMYTDGSSLWQATTFVEDGQPCWAPDSSRLAFASERQSDRRMRLYVLDRIPLKEDEKTEGRKLAYPHKCPYCGVPGKHPCWTPDGRLIFQGCDEWATGSSCGLVIASPDGGIGTLITSDPHDTVPTVYGEQAIFASPTRDDNWELYSVSVNGGEVQRLTENECNDGMPVFSPDGRAVAFVSDEGGAWAIWAMNPDGSNRRKLFELGGGYGEGEYDWTLERISWAP
jgi:Tol biopolymer transport system component